MENHLPTLDYATPGRRRSPVRASLSAFFGVLVGLIAAFMLFVGIEGIVELVRDWQRNDAGDVYAIFLVNAIGLFCAFIAFRWTRAAARMFAQSQNS